MHGRIRSLGNEVPGSNSRRKRGRPFQIPEGLRSPWQWPRARWLHGGQAERLPGRHATRAETPLRASSPPRASCLRGARLSDFPAHLQACAFTPPSGACVATSSRCRLDRGLTPGLVPRVGRDVPVPVTCVSDERREGSRPLSPPAALRRHCSRPPEGHQLSYQHKQHGVTPASGWVSTHICP